MEDKKLDVKVGIMDKETQAKVAGEYALSKKYKVQVEVLGKTKWAYCDNLADLDPFLKATKGRIIEVKEQKHG